MTKVLRTIRMESELSKKLDAICVRHGDVTYHIENALSAYLIAIKKPKKHVRKKSKGHF